MQRVSTNMSNDNMQYYMKLREWRMNEMENKIAGQTRIKNLRDDPVAAAHSVRYDSKITRLEQFSKNVETVQSRGRVAEGYIQQAVSILQRVRELAVTGAQGTFTPQETKYMGEEVNQLLNELVQIGNAQSGDGTTIFSGDRNLSEAFRAVSGNVPGSDNKVITSVNYVGTIEKTLTEISDGSYIPSNFPGNQVFWAEPMYVLSDKNAAAYQVTRDSQVRIDGVTIDLKTGDNIHAVISKINDSGAGVKAKLDPVKNSLALETVSPHQIWIEDVGNGTVMQDLGVLSGNNDLPPHNFSQDAMVSGGSMFDMVMYVRDRLYEGDSYNLGGAGIKGMDSALDNALGALADLGARDERLDSVGNRLAYETPEMIGRSSNEKDLDLAKAITDLKMLEYTHKASLQTAARVLQPTLLDFLR